MEITANVSMKMYDATFNDTTTTYFSVDDGKLNAFSIVITNGIIFSLYFFNNKIVLFEITKL